MLYLKTMKIVTLALLALLVPRLSWGAESQTSVDEYFTGLSYGTYSDLVASQNAFSLEMQPADTTLLNQDIYGSKTKSTRKAFIYSLLLPGAGELYGDSKLKAAAFLSMEALFWVSYFHYDGKGDDKKTEYRLYADQNWDEGKYRDSLIYTYFTESNPNTPNNLLDYVVAEGDTLTFFNYQSRVDEIKGNEEIIYNMEESLSVVDRESNQYGFTHHSVNISDNEYYENIGKYNQFAWGWGEYQGSPLLALRSAYLDMRQDANSLYDKAKWSVVASMANHIISAIDAALTVKSFNRKQDRFKEASLKIRMVPEEGGLSPRAVLTLKFD